MRIIYENKIETENIKFEVGNAYYGYYHSGTRAVYIIKSRSPKFVTVVRELFPEDGAKKYKIEMVNGYETFYVSTSDVLVTAKNMI